MCCHAMRQNRAIQKSMRTYKKQREFTNGAVPAAPSAVLL